MAEDDFGTLLDNWLDSVEAVTVNLPKEKQALVTMAGATVLQTSLKQVTKAKHYRKGMHYPGYSDGELHLADDVRAQPLNLGLELDGTSTVGFGYTAYIARFLNNGTKFIKGDHFVENTRKEMTEAVLTAEAIAYGKMIKEAQG